MIDEELYVLATQELNSDSRREDLWARAIALASDDHDEARYLYTNLRVEELVQQRKTEELRATDPAAGGTPDPISVAGSPTISDTPVTENLDFEEMPVDGSDAQKPSPSLVSHMQRKAEELNNELRGKLHANENKTDQSADNTGAQSVGDSAPENGPIQERRITNQIGLYVGEDESAAHDNTGIDDDFDPLERTEPEGFSLNDNSLELTAPDNLPPVFEQDEQYDPAYDEADSLYGQPMDGARQAEQAEQLGGAYSNHSDSEDARIATETIDRFDATIEPVLLSGRAFTVLKHSDGSRKAIKLGSSWPALLFTLPWLMYKKLWGTALVYLVMAAVLLFAVISTGMNLLDAGADATQQQKLIFGAFAVLALVGMFYLPFKNGNNWSIKRLRRKGYTHHTDINAQTGKDALDLARE